MSAAAILYPEMRAEVLRSVATLADAAYQQRVWVERVYPDAKFYDDFKANVNCLFDDCHVLPDPLPAVGNILMPGDEVARLAELGAVLDALIDRHPDLDLANVLADDQWPEVRRLAGQALAAMVLAGT